MDIIEIAENTCLASETWEDEGREYREFVFSKNSIKAFAEEIIRQHEENTK